MAENGGWSLNCACGKGTCRKIIRDFKTLSAPLKKHYRELGVVPAFILEGDK
jgi:hypothetical protein